MLNLSSITVHVLCKLTAVPLCQCLPVRPVPGLALAIRFCSGSGKTFISKYTRRLLTTINILSCQFTAFSSEKKSLLFFKNV